MATAKQNEKTYFYASCFQSGNIVKVNTGRLTLCEVTAQVLAKCFEILGLQYVEKM